MELLLFTIYGEIHKRVCVNCLCSQQLLHIDGSIDMGKVET